MIYIDPKTISDEAYRALCVAINASIRRLKRDPRYVEGFKKWKAEREEAQENGR